MVDMIKYIVNDVIEELGEEYGMKFSCVEQTSLSIELDCWIDGIGECTYFVDEMMNPDLFYYANKDMVVAENMLKSEIISCFVERFGPIHPRYEKIITKPVKDSDGFWSEYSMWYDYENEKYLFIFGDSDVYTPENSDPDWECDTYDEAVEWWNDYEGFDDEDDIDY